MKKVEFFCYINAVIAARHAQLIVVYALVYAVVLSHMVTRDNHCLVGVTAIVPGANALTRGNRAHFY
jgi:hypothetical protein